ncbi:unnamed protein product [Cylicocyclus nassatus]|uniref:Uncharacterized protein n=1 Tax=Cylicocyclus nassatus TaxID=53992 RepID=A0AA36H1E2_CYLNA|nr:unnamed protein product [Cylicocyclus nassatus]
MAEARDYEAIAGTMCCRWKHKFLAGAAIYLLTYMVWLCLSRMTPSKWMNFLMSTIAFSGFTVNPAIYLIVNNTLRKRVLNTVIRKRHVIVTPTKRNPENKSMYKISTPL